MWVKVFLLSGGVSGLVVPQGGKGRMFFQRRATVASPPEVVDQCRFLSEAQALEVESKFGTPCYVYDAATLEARALDALSMPNKFGLTARYAMKALPNASILRLFDHMGLHFDASSTYEARRAMKVGIAASKISLSTQQFDDDFADLVEEGLTVNACSLSQLEKYGKRFPGSEVGVRFNPGVGSGGTSKTNVGGPASSFGIWHGAKDDVLSIAKTYDLKITRVHTHIGSGSDPLVWQKAAKMSIDLCEFIGPSCTTLNMGGGYKVARMKTEKSTDLNLIAEPLLEEFQAFYDKTGTKLHLEIEPGTFLVANAGALVSKITDVVSTKKDTKEGGRTFLKLDCGMTDILRPSLYGSQHPIIVVPQQPTEETENYVIVGHCCESGDLLTPAPDQPDTLSERTTLKATEGDLAVIDSAGAYCAAMSTKGYNSFPDPPEVLLAKDGSFKLIKDRSTLHQLLQNEIIIDDPETMLK